MSDISFSATGCTGLLTLDAHHGYGQPHSTCEIKCISHALSLNDEITATINGNVVFTGNAKTIIHRRSKEGNIYVINAYDKLIQASDYFIAADDPDDPLSVSNTSAESLVTTLLALASISSVSTTSPGLTLAVDSPYDIDRVYVYDLVSAIAKWCGYHVWADEDGTVHFESLPPYPVAASSHSFTVGNTGNLLVVSYTLSEENLRNRVVVYGANSLVGIASASSPYLPAGFYKTAVFGHPLLDTQGACDDAADWNLAKWNRPTKMLGAAIVGDSSVRFGEVVTVTEPGVGITGDWFVHNISHIISKSGYVCNLTLSQ